MHERLVIAVLVGRIELQVTVEIKLKASLSLRDHDSLIGARLGVDDRMRQGVLFREHRERVGLEEARSRAVRPRGNARARSATSPRWASNGRSKNVPHSPTAAFRMPNTSDVRTSPRRGTKKIGKSSDATRAPM